MVGMWRRSWEGREDGEEDGCGDGDGKKSDDCGFDGGERHQKSWTLRKR